MGPGVGRVTDQRFAGAGASAGVRPLGRAPAAPVRAARQIRAHACGAAADAPTRRSADGRGTLVALTGALTGHVVTGALTGHVVTGAFTGRATAIVAGMRSDPPGTRSGRDIPRAPWGTHSRRLGHRTSRRWVRRDLQGAASDGGVRPVPARIRR